MDSPPASPPSEYRQRIEEKMPITYYTEANTGLVIVTVAGAVTPEEQRTHVARIFTDAALPQPLRILSDRRGQHDIPSTALVREIGLLIDHTPQAATARLAFVVDRRAQYGVGRMFSAYTTKMQVAVFADEDRAREWLLDRPDG